MKKELNSKTVAGLKPGAKYYEVWDTKLPGFILRVRPSGVMTYTLNYARGKYLTIGTTDKLDPAQARLIAKEKYAEYALGNDPIAEKKQAKAENYLTFLNATYKPWLDVHHKHPKETYAMLVSGFKRLHSLPLNKITTGEIEKWRTERKLDGVSKSTINRQLSDLRACLKRAEEIWELKTGITKIKQEKTEEAGTPRWLSADEETTLRNALDAREAAIKAGRDSGNQWREERGYKLYADLHKLTFVDHLKPCVLLSLNCGLRRGELLKLKWQNVDFKLRNLTVVGLTSKSGKSRDIPLNDEAMAILNAWHKQTKGFPASYVFGNEAGKPLQGMKSAWAKLLRDAKITGFRWHDLRHSFASKLVNNGVSLAVVQDLMGHGSFKMTNRYAHVSQPVKQAAVDKLVAVS